MPFIRSTTVLAELRRQGERFDRMGERFDRIGERQERDAERQAQRDERFERELQLHRQVMAEGISAIRENSRAVADMREEMRANTRAIEGMREAIDDMRQDVQAGTRALLHVLDRFEGPENGHAAA